MLEGIKKFATAAKLWSPDDAGDEGQSAPASPAQSTQPALVVVPQSTSARPAFIGGADQEMVATIKSAVLKASPVLALFATNCELMQKAFPNDEISRMRAALAMTAGVEKQVLLAEMQRTVGSALQGARASASEEHRAERMRAVGSLEQQIASHESNIQATEQEIARLQGVITEKRNAMSRLQGEMRTAETDLARRDAVVQASFAEVERQLQLMTQSFAQI